MHPYAIRQEIYELTAHSYYPHFASVQTALKKLEANGYLEEVWSSPFYWMKARRGAPYELTMLGRSQVKTELRMYRELSDKMWLELKTRDEIEQRRKIYEVFD